MEKLFVRVDFNPVPETKIGLSNLVIERKIFTLLLF